MSADTRTNLTLPDDLAQMVDDYWHRMRLSSRNEAIRRLLWVALGPPATTLDAKLAKPAKEQRR